MEERVIESTETDQDEIIEIEEIAVEEEEELQVPFAVIQNILVFLVVNKCLKKVTQLSSEKNQ